MKVIAIISTILNIILTILLIAMFNTKISWHFDDFQYDFKLGDIFLEKIKGGN